MSVTPPALFPSLPGFRRFSAATLFPSRYIFPALNCVAAGGITAVGSDVLGSGQNACAGDIWLAGADGAPIPPAG